MPARVNSGMDAEFSGSLEWGEFEYAIAECPWEVRFADVRQGQGSFRPEDYEAGVLFGRNAELRWRRMRNGKFRWVRYREGAAEGTEATDAAELNWRRMVLWGEPVEGSAEPEWWEPRIQRWIKEYPGAFGGKRVAVALKPYRIEAEVPRPGGEEGQRVKILLARYVGLEEVPKEEQ